MDVSDHRCEYVPGDPHCVVCYERADAVELDRRTIDRMIMAVVRSMGAPR